MNPNQIREMHLQKDLENSRNMSLLMKGIAILLAFTGMICSRKNDTLVLIVILFVIPVIFLMDLLYQKKIAYNQEQLFLIDQEFHTQTAEKKEIMTEQDFRTKIPVVCYVVLECVCVIALILFHQA